MFRHIWNVVFCSISNCWISKCLIRQDRRHEYFDKGSISHVVPRAVSVSVFCLRSRDIWRSIEFLITPVVSIISFLAQKPRNIDIAQRWSTWDIANLGILRFKYCQAFRTQEQSVTFEYKIKWSPIRKCAFSSNTIRYKYYLTPISSKALQLF